MKQEMKQEITLAVGCTAEPDTCGSCKFFERSREYDSAYGRCGIRLPLKVAFQADIRLIDPKQYDREYTGTEDQIQDTRSCDLYRSDGKSYIVQRRVGT